MDAAGDGGLGRSLGGKEDGRPVPEGERMNKYLTSSSSHGIYAISFLHKQEPVCAFGLV